MTEGRYRDKQIKFYVTEDEYQILKRRAKSNGMSVGKYIRETVIHSDGESAPTIDIAPLKSIDHELKKQGTNLNQLMRFLNTYGIEDYNVEEVKRVLGLKGELYVELSNIFGDLRDEAERHHVRILDSSGSETVEDDAEPSAKPAHADIMDAEGGEAERADIGAIRDAGPRADEAYEVPGYAKHARR